MTVGDFRDIFGEEKRNKGKGKGKGKVRGKGKGKLTHQDIGIDEDICMCVYMWIVSEHEIGYVCYAE